MTADAVITEDRFLAGSVIVLQPADGYRAGMDAVLLAAALSAEAGETLAEAGSGAGGALLCAAGRLAGCGFTGFEKNAGMAALLDRSAALNGFGDRARARVHDIAERLPELENRFDQGFSNPPFFEPGAARLPAEGKRAAYMAETPLREWVLFLLHVVKPGGRITMIHRAAALADLLEELSRRTGEIEVLPIRPAPGAVAHRVLVRARKGLRRGPVKLYDGLALHDAAGGPSSARAAAALSGGVLDWA